MTGDEMDKVNPVAERVRLIEERIKLRTEGQDPLPADQLRKEARDHNFALSRWSLASLIAINGGAVLGLAQFQAAMGSIVPAASFFAGGFTQARLSAFFARRSAIAESSLCLEHLQLDRLLERIRYSSSEPGPTPDELYRSTRGVEKASEALTQAMASGAEPDEIARLMKEEEFFENIELNTKWLSRAADLMKRTEQWLDQADASDENIQAYRKKMEFNIQVASLSELLSLAAFVAGVIVFGQTITG
jgi:hypothetical protein